jgi:hypothetical protein
MKKILKTMASVLLIAAFAATAVSCSKDDEDINILGSDVYVAGRDGSVAKVWKTARRCRLLMVQVHPILRQALYL